MECCNIAIINISLIFFYIIQIIMYLLVSEMGATKS